MCSERFTTRSAPPTACCFAARSLAIHGSPPSTGTLARRKAGFLQFLDVFVKESILAIVQRGARADPLKQGLEVPVLRMT
jgi:hypothetical protein